MIPFKVQFDKLTEAYIKDKVEPYRECACFIGNLLNNTWSWSGARIYKSFGNSVPSYSCRMSKMDAPSIQSIINESEGTYTPEEIILLENLFLHTLEKETINHASTCPLYEVSRHPNYEEALFKAFCVTLDKLKEIHISKGENVEEFTFTKRKLEVS